MTVEEILSALNAVEKKINELLSSRASDQEATQKLLHNLQEEQTKLARDLVELQQKSAFRASDDQPRLTLGEEFVQSNEFVSLSSGSTRSIRVSLQADAIELSEPITSEGIVQPDRRPGVSHPPFYRKKVEGLLAGFNTTSNMVEFPREKWGSWQNKAAAVAEGAVKPRSTLELELVQSPVQVIAHTARITKQMLADAPSVAAYINTRMMDGLAWKVETQILRGDGKTPNLKGLLAPDNYAPHGFTEKDGLTTIDLIAKCIATVAALEFNPSHILLNPLDWCDITLAKDNTGKYIIGDPGKSTQNMLWGLPVITTQAMHKGKFLVGDFRAAGAVYTRQGITIEVFDQDEDNVSKNLVTIRAECRKALCIDQPYALIGGDLTMPKSA